MTPCRYLAAETLCTFPGQRWWTLTNASEECSGPAHGWQCCKTCPFYSPPKRPSIARQAVTFTSSTARWIAAGSPVRTDEEVDRIAAICKACEHFAAGKCNLCGCAVKGVAEEGMQAGMWNKIRRQTESCPVGKW